jgi:hypothetical protein
MKDEIRQGYEIKSIQRSEPPAGAEGSVWCRYVIKQGDNIIHGYRPGPLKTVRGEIKALVKQLNERRSSNRSQMAPIKRTRH